MTANTSKEQTEIRNSAIEDKVGHKIQAKNAGWSFGGDVAATFEQHIEQSIPGYREGHELIAAISDFFVVEDSLIIELGCSTGALTKLLAKRNDHKRVRILGLEIEAAMVDFARADCAAFDSVEIRQADIVREEFERADLIVSYYTIQFIRPAMRQQVFNRVYESLNWGGAFVMFEKVRGPDARFQDIINLLYVDYKLQRGFQPNEIVAKSRSLKGVLEPFSTAANFDMLQRAGFQDYMTIYKNICFEGFVAIK